MGTDPENSFFIDSELSLLSDVLDVIIPADGSLDGAGTLGVAQYVDGIVGKSTELRPSFASGIEAIEIVTNERFTTTFAQLSQDQKVAVLQAVEGMEPKFFGELVRQTYNGYYTHPKIREHLGEDARPPQPEGYSLEPMDLNLLEGVKSRGQVYRDV